VYAACVCASASPTDAISALNVSVSVSSSRLDPVSGSRAATSWLAAIAASDADNRPIGSLSSRASQKLPTAASAIASTPMSARLRVTSRMAVCDDSSIGPSA